jgi:hypothetical protein
MAENHKHIFISGNVKPEKYKASSKPGKQPSIPQRDRAAHSAKLLQLFDAIWNQKKGLEQARSAEKIATREGTYLSFTSAAGHDLITKSLESMSGKKSETWIRLLNVKDITDEQGQKQTQAIVYVPNGKEGYFIKKLVEYRTQNFRDTDNPKNADLVNSINDVSIALLEGLWTDNIQLIPSENSKWCEAWLNVNTKDKQEKEQITLLDLLYSLREPLGGFSEIP